MTHPIVKRSLSPDPAVRRDPSPQAGARSAITDLGWLPPQAGYVIVVTDPGEILAEADPGARNGGWRPVPLSGRFLTAASGG